MLEKIISGGQTGVDRAALDLALEHGFPCGGWCPKDRKAEDGRIADRYPLTETPSRKYSKRTKWNVCDSDGTLIIATGKLTGGTLLTVRFAEQWDKPIFRVDFSGPAGADWLWNELIAKEIRVLNIAGPRESSEPGVYSRAMEYLRDLMELSDR